MPKLRSYIHINVITKFQSNVHVCVCVMQAFVHACGDQYISFDNRSAISEMKTN